MKQVIMRTLLLDHKYIIYLVHFDDKEMIWRMKYGNKMKINSKRIENGTKKETECKLNGNVIETKCILNDIFSSSSPSCQLKIFTQEGPYHSKSISIKVILRWCFLLILLYDISKLLADHAPGCQIWRIKIENTYIRQKW